MTEILVVDDDFALQRMVRLVLEKEGHTVRSADSAETGEGKDASDAKGAASTSTRARSVRPSGLERTMR